MEYNIAAIPTTYNGIQYRSRLEARWAAFFDTIEWKFQYEPFDLGCWSPGFLVVINDRHYLFEVKPVTEFHAETAEKMDRALLQKPQSSPKFGGIFIAGVSPEIDHAEGALRLGWINPIHPSGFAGWRPNYLCWYQRKHIPHFNSGLCRADVLKEEGVFGYPEFGEKIWNRASNTAQWQPKS